VTHRKKENACWLSKWFYWAVRNNSIYLGILQIKVEIMDK